MTCQECDSEVKTLAARYTEPNSMFFDVPIVLRIDTSRKWYDLKTPGTVWKYLGRLDMAHNVAPLQHLRSYLRTASRDAPTAPMYRLVLYYAPDLDTTRRFVTGPARTHRPLWHRLGDWISAAALASVIEDDEPGASSWLIPRDAVSQTTPGSLSSVFGSLLSDPTTGYASADAAADIDMDDSPYPGLDAAMDAAMKEEDEIFGRYTGDPYCEMTPDDEKKFEFPSAHDTYCDKNILYTTKLRLNEATLSHAIERRAALLNSIALMLETKAPAKQQVMRQNIDAVLMQWRSSAKDVGIDALGYFCWRWYCEFTEAGKSMFTSFERCESYIVGARVRLDVDGTLSTAPQVTGEYRVFHKNAPVQYDNTNALPERVRAEWQPVPKVVYAFPFDSPLGIQYLKGRRYTRAPTAQTVHIVAEPDPRDGVPVPPFITKTFTVSRYVLVGGYVYVPDFDDIVVPLRHAMVRHVQRQYFRRDDVDWKFEMHVTNAFKTMARYNTIPAFQQWCDTINATSAGGVRRHIPKGTSVKRLHRLVPPCMLLDASFALPGSTAATGHEEEDTKNNAKITPRRGDVSTTRTRLVSYRGRTKLEPVQGQPRSHMNRFHQFTMLGIFTHMQPKQVSAAFGHNTPQDAKMAADAARMTKTSTSCATMHSKGMCPYQNLYPASLYGNYAQIACMKDIESLASKPSTLSSSLSSATTSAAAATTTTTTAAASTYAPPSADAAAPAARTQPVHDVEHAIIAALALAPLPSAEDADPSAVVIHTAGRMRRTRRVVQRV